MQWKFLYLTLFALVPGLKRLVLWNAYIYAALHQEGNLFDEFRWMHSFNLLKSEKKKPDQI